MSKCDFCDNEATCYGSHQCYLACDDHVKEGEAVEDKMFEAMYEGYEGSYGLRNS